MPKFTTTDRASVDHGVKILVYSESGIGKTTLCATAPNPIILSAESGLLSLKKYKIPVMLIESVEDLNDAYQWITTDKAAAQFQTVCLDSVTEIAEVILAKSKKVAKDPRQAYGDLIDKMTDLVKKFRDLKGKHVYMAAKMEKAKDELSGMTMFSPSMPGSKMGPALPYLFDEVFNLRIMATAQGEKYRALITQPDLQYVAKDRSNSLNPIEPPNLTNVINKILGV